MNLDKEKQRNVYDHFIEMLIKGMIESLFLLQPNSYSTVTFFCVIPCRRNATMTTCLCFESELPI